MTFKQACDKARRLSASAGKQTRTEPRRDTFFVYYDDDYQTWSIISSSSDWYVNDVIRDDQVKAAFTQGRAW